MKITERELYEISMKILSEVSALEPAYFDAKTMSITSKNFRMLKAMERPKYRLVNKRAHQLIIFALVSFAALTIKMGCEGYFQK